jgi:RNA polymerase sigma-70 factor (ECF subfamily)
MASDSAFRVPNVPDVPNVPYVPDAPVIPSRVAKLYQQSQAARWGLPIDEFFATLEASVKQAFPDRAPDEAALDRYLATLHLDDLALASACAMGSESAWNHFMAEHRPGLYRAADAIDPTGGARELADALYADLFGLRERDGVRQSLFRYFHGRSRLTTWLRAVLSQRHVDRVRTDRRHDPLDDEDTTTGRADAGHVDPERPRFVALTSAALQAAIAGLAPRDRLRLRCYYAQNLKLAAIGRLLGEHEGTVSRHLTRTRQALREAVEQHLRREHNFDQATIAECFSAVVDDPGSIDLAKMIDPEPDARTGLRIVQNK